VCDNLILNVMKYFHSSYFLPYSSEFPISIMVLDLVSHRLELWDVVLYFTI